MPSGLLRPWPLMHPEAPGGGGFAKAKVIFRLPQPLQFDVSYSIRACSRRLNPQNPKQQLPSAQGQAIDDSTRAWELTIEHRPSPWRKTVKQLYNSAALTKLYQYDDLFTFKGG